jgi:hypothetical protein
MHGDETRDVITAPPHPGHRRLSDRELRRVGEVKHPKAILLNQIPTFWDFRGEQQNSTTAHW